MALLIRVSFLLLLSIFLEIQNSQIYVVEGKPRAVTPIRSDVIVTKYGPEIKTPEDSVNKDLEETHDNIQNGAEIETDNRRPGFMRRQLMRLGSYARKVGAGFNGSSGRVSAFIETMCDILKSIIPVAAAICQVGQFKFCAATEDGVLGTVGGASGFDSIASISGGSVVDLGMQD